MVQCIKYTFQHLEHSIKDLIYLDNTGPETFVIYLQNNMLTLSIKKKLH
jgi:hypothetical protein